MSIVLTHLKRVQTLWNLTQDEVLKMIHIKKEIWEIWEASASEQSQSILLPEMDKALTLIHIQKKLETFLPQPEQQLEWLEKPHPYFQNYRPIELILSTPEESSWVAYFLESATSIWSKNNTEHLMQH